MSKSFEPTASVPLLSSSDRSDEPFGEASTPPTAPGVDQHCVQVPVLG
jgi:hypothetical protein